MGWKFWERQKYGELSAQVRRGLKKDFDVSWEELNRMGCVEESEQLEGRNITRIYVFDSDQIGDGENSVKSFEDLNRHSEAILFEVLVEESGSMSVMDKRTAA